MTDMELVNQFLSRSDLSGTEEILKARAIDLDQKLGKARQEFQKLTEQHGAKQAEVIALSQQLEGVLQVALEAAKQQAGASATAPVAEPQGE
jgi:hypothetical protein